MHLDGAEALEPSAGRIIESDQSLTAGWRIAMMMMVCGDGGRSPERIPVRSSIEPSPIGHCEESNDGENGMRRILGIAVILTVGPATPGFSQPMPVGPGSTLRRATTSAAWAWPLTGRPGELLNAQAMAINADTVDPPQRVHRGRARERERQECNTSP